MKREWDWIRARVTRWVIVFFLGLKPNFCSVYYVGNTVQMTRLSTKYANTQHLLAYCVRFCRCLSACVCLTAWIKCSRSSKQRVSDLNLRDLVRLKQSVLLFGAAGCMQNRCQRVRASACFYLNKSHMPSLSLELWGELWPYMYSLSDSVRKKTKKQHQISYSRGSWTLLGSCKWKG